MRITRLRLENWRNFASVDIHIQNRLFIVGANASGKSNLLDAIRFLHELVIPGGGFQRAVARRGGISSIRNLAARQNSDIVIDVELGEVGFPEWRYRIAFNNDNRRKEVPVLQEESVWQADGPMMWRPIIKRPNTSDQQDPQRLTQTVLEQTFANQDFRAIADFFGSIQYSHLVPQLVRDSDRYMAQETDPFGGNFLEHIANYPDRSRNARLKRINAALKIAVPQLQKLRLQPDKRGVPHLQANYQHWRPHGKWQDERDFSDGTLRLIGLLWTIQDGDGPLLLEEPELSLHAAIVRYIPAMIYSVLRDRKGVVRQQFVSTHSAELLNAEGIDASEMLMLRPDTAGTLVELGADVAEIRAQLEAGLSPADVVLPYTAPANVDQLAQLALFD